MLGEKITHTVPLFLVLLFALTELSDFRWCKKWFKSAYGLNGAIMATVWSLIILFIIGAYLLIQDENSVYNTKIRHEIVLPVSGFTMLLTLLIYVWI